MCDYLLLITMYRLLVCAATHCYLPRRIVTPMQAIMVLLEKKNEHTRDDGRRYTTRQHLQLVSCKVVPDSLVEKFKMFAY